MEMDQEQQVQQPERQGGCRAERMLRANYDSIIHYLTLKKYAREIPKLLSGMNRTHKWDVRYKLDDSVQVRQNFPIASPLPHSTRTYGRDSTLRSFARTGMPDWSVAETAFV